MKKKKLVQAIALSLALSSGMYTTAVVEAAAPIPILGLVEVTAVSGIGVATVIGTPPQVSPIGDIFQPGQVLSGGVHLLGAGVNLDMTGMVVAGGLLETGAKNSITFGVFGGGFTSTGQSYIEIANTGAFAGLMLNAGTLDVNGQLVGNVTGTGSILGIGNGYLTIGATGGVIGSINETFGDISIENGALAGNIVDTKGSINVTGGQGNAGNNSDKGNIAGNIVNTKGNVNFDSYADIVTTSATVNNGASIDKVTGDVSIMNHSTITSANAAINKVDGNVDVGNAAVIKTDKSAITNTGGNVTISGKNTEVIAKTGNAIENTEGDVIIEDRAYVEATTGSAVFNTKGDVLVDGGTLKSKDDTIKNVEGQVIINKGSHLISTEGYGISGVKGQIKIEEGAKIDSKLSSFAGATGTIEVSKGSFNSTEGDGFVSGNDQNGVIAISDTTVTAKKNGVDLSNGTSTTTTLNNVDIKAEEGNGLNVSGRSQVAVNGVNIGAGATGLVAKNVTNLAINTTMDDHKITAGKVGIHIADGTDATIGGTQNLDIAVGVNKKVKTLSLNGSEDLGAGILVSSDKGVGTRFNVNQGGKTIAMELAGSTAGLAATGAGSELNFNHEKNVIKSAVGGADHAVGIISSDSAIVNMDKGTIDLVGKSATGVIADGGTVNLSNLDDRFKVQATGTDGSGTDSALGLGVRADHAGTANISDTKISVSGAGDANAMGLEGRNGGKINLSYDREKVAANPDLNLNRIDVSTEGTGLATGIFAQGTDTAIQLNNVKSIAVNANGTGSAVGLWTGGGTTLTLNDPNLESMDVTAVGGYATGIAAEDKSIVNLDLTKNLTVTADKTATGILANDSVVNFTGKGEEASVLLVKGADPSAALAVGLAGQINLKNVGVALDKDTTGALLQGTTNGGTVNAAGSSLIGHTVYDATEAVAGESNRLGINLDQSMLFGTANVINDVDKGAKIDVSVAGAGKGAANSLEDSSYWYMTGDSDMRGTMHNTGIVEFAPKDEKKLTYSTLNADKLTGDGGLYSINTTIHNSDTYLDGNGRQADMIVATGSASDAKGSIFIKNDDTKVAWYQARMDQDLVVTAPDSTAQFTLANGQNAYELGSWAYQLASETISQEEADKLYGGKYAGATGWHLQNFDLSNQATAALSSVISPDIWYLETNALYSNINQYDKDKDNSNVWAQAMHGKIKTNDTVSHPGYSGSNDVDQTFTGLTAGVDKKFSSNARGDFWGGLMFGHGKGDISYTGGSTDMKSTHVGLYGVYRAANDFYMGGVLKYNHYSNDISARSRAGQYIANDYSQHGWGASIMAGKKIMQNNGWFVEPQVEFGYNKTSGTDYTFANGMDVNVGDSSSLRLRGGVSIGRQHVYDDGAKLDTYVKLSLVHEFDGESTVKLYGEQFDVDYGGTWGQYKLGMNFKSAKNTDFNLAITYEDGGDRESPLGIEGGVKWSF